MKFKYSPIYKIIIIVIIYGFCCVVYNNSVAWSSFWFGYVCGILFGRVLSILQCVTRNRWWHRQISCELIDNVGWNNHFYCCCWSLCSQNDYMLQHLNVAYCRNQTTLSVASLHINNIGNAINWWEHHAQAQHSRFYPMEEHEECKRKNEKKYGNYVYSQRQSICVCARLFV